MRGRGGYALVLVMGWIGVLFVSVSWMLQLGQSSLESARGAVRSEQALGAAEAGLVEALVRLREGDLGPGELVLGEARASWSVVLAGAGTVPAGVALGEGWAYVACSARLQGAVRSVAAVVRGTVFVGRGGRLGPTHPLVPTLNGLDVAWKDLGSWAQDEQALSRPSVLPRVVVPEVGASLGDRSVSLGSVSLAPGRYGSVGVGALGTLRLQAGTYVVDRLDSALGRVVAEGPVQIFVRQSTHLGVSAIVNNTLVPKNFVVNLAAGAHADVGGGALAAAVIYGPDAEVTLLAGGEVFGAVVAREVQALAASRVHFDESLRDWAFDPSQGSSSQAVLSWQRL